MQTAPNQAYPTGNELRQLLDPVGVEEFIADYADRRALLIKGAADKFAGLGFDQEAFLASAERFDPGAQRLKVAIPSEGEAEAYVPILPMQARGLFQCGLTVCATALSDVNPQLGAFAEGVRHSLSIPDLRFNAYLSPHDSGFNLHYDVQPIFLLQIAGAKRWWYGSEPVSPTPRVYSGAWSDKPALDTLEHTVLEAGDVLYLPAFTWHRARADGFSLGITLGTKGAHNKVIRHALESSPFFSEWPVEAIEPPLDPASVSCDAVPEQARAFLERQHAALQRVVSDLTIEDLWQRWVDQVQAPKGPRPQRRDVEVYRTLQIRRASRFPVHLDRHEESGESVVRVRSGGRQVRFPSASEPFVRWLLHSDGPFTAADATARGGESGLTRAEAKHILRDLMAIGVLDPLDAE